jgi:cytochrome c peroxidase
VPERNWTDNKARGGAAMEVDRNTPTLMNVRLGRWYGWDGAATACGRRASGPILDRAKLGATPRHVAELMRKDEAASCRYRARSASRLRPTDDEQVLRNVGKILAAFPGNLRDPADAVRPLPQTRWQRASASSRPGFTRMPRSAASGSSSARAAARAVTADRTSRNGEFATTASHGRRTHRRGEGAQASRFSLAGATTTTRRRRCARSRNRKAGAFKVPTLRAPDADRAYGHDGKRETLADVVRHYSEKARRRCRAQALRGRADRPGRFPGIDQHASNPGDPKTWALPIAVLGAPPDAEPRRRDRRHRASGNMDDDLFRALYQAFLRYQVLLFPPQDACRRDKSHSRALWRGAGPRA